MNKIKLFIVFLSVGLFWISCQHKLSEDQLSNVIVDTICDPNTVYFVNEIRPMIASNCAYVGCHDAVTAEHGYDLSSYSAIMTSNLVQAGKGSNSKLYKVTSSTSDEKMPPPPKVALSDAQREKIKKWINQGAKNNECLGCDSSNVTFNGNIWPIIQSNCQGCHSGTNPSNGLSLTTYAQVNSIVQDGRLMGSITGQPGYSAMPKNGTLSPCEIALIKIWINNGAQNN